MADDLPVTFDETMVPFSAHGDYVPHYRDTAGTVHFFAVVDQPSPEDEAARALCYFRACQVDDRLMHHAQPVMPVTGVTASPWPLPALHLYLEDGDLSAAQRLARQAAQASGIPFPDRLPDLAPEEPALTPPTWALHVVPAHDPDGARLGYSAVCIVDFGTLAETLSPESSTRAQWLEVAQFETEKRAQQFREDLMSLAGMDELSHLTGPGFAEAVAGDLGMSGGWQVMDKEALEKLEAGEWSPAINAGAWHPLPGAEWSLADEIEL